MPTVAGAEFTKVFTFDGSSYTDITLEMQSPAGTSTAVLAASSHYLYLGHDYKFDLAVFDVDTAGSLGALTWQFYNGSADWDFISNVKKSVSIPVIANGDVTALNDVEMILSRSGADGVMVGRGTYGKPWFLGQIIEFLNSGDVIPDPKLSDQYKILREHYLDMLHHYGSYTGMRMARKHLGWYTKGLPNSAEFRAKINKIPTIERALEAIDSYYDSVLEITKAAK